MKSAFREKGDDKVESDDSDKKPLSGKLSALRDNQPQQRNSAVMSNHRLYRSAVRPFFCCGSQFSLNSISEFIEIPTSSMEAEETEYVDITDDEDETELMNSLSIEDVNQASIKVVPEKVSPRQTNSRRKKSENTQDKGTMRKKFFTLKLRGRLQVPKNTRKNDEQEEVNTEKCVCTSFRRTDEVDATASGSLGATGSLTWTSNPFYSEDRVQSRPNSVWGQTDLFLLSQRINFDELYPTEDIDEQRIAQRAREMEEGIDVNDVWVKAPVLGAVGGSVEPCHHRESCSRINKKREDFYGEISYPQVRGTFLPRTLMTSSEMMASRELLANPHLNRPRSQPLQSHSQVDFIHCLVPDISAITNCSFYWGVMDRYQAEQLLDNKPEGTFLLRDSAQEDYLFSVSFRRYGRSLHARIEQWNHKFSFDSHDPGVFASESVCGLIEHYKDPNCCMFFEPMLTIPLHRNFPFSLQHLCRATLSDRITYDGINFLPLPRSLKEYLTYYHYKQKVRIRRFDLNA